MLVLAKMGHLMNQDKTRLGIQVIVVIELFMEIGDEIGD